MKELKAIFLDFPSTASNTANANVSCNFLVKHIHVKSLTYQRTGVSVSPAQYGVLFSSLIFNQPLGVFYNDSAYSTNPHLDNILEFTNPTMINGNYSFWLVDASGQPMLPVDNGDNMILMVSFESDDV